MTAIEFQTAPTPTIAPPKGQAGRRGLRFPSLLTLFTLPTVLPGKGGWYL